MNPSTKEEFVELSDLIVGKLSNYEVRISHICENLICDLTILSACLVGCFLNIYLITAVQ